jgi:ubiquinone/menaquinone biosynthesis C-methylase UbiE
MKYDSTGIPAAYDAGRSLGPAALARWMATVSARVAGRSITTLLDMGCGTGRFSEALASQCEANVIGLDPSRRMLARARAKRRDSRVHYAAGSGEAIPLPAQSVDVVFLSMVFHHFENPLGAARECRRVLKAGGSAFVRTGTREQIAFYPYVPFFPSSRRVLEQRLPSAKRVQSTFEAAGFRLASAEVIIQEIASSEASYADRLAVGADSVLASLPAAEFAAGLAALRSHAARSEEQEVVEPIDLFVFR